MKVKVDNGDLAIELGVECRSGMGRGVGVRGLVHLVGYACRNI